VLFRSATRARPDACSRRTDAADGARRDAASRNDPSRSATVTASRVRCSSYRRRRERRRLKGGCAARGASSNAQRVAAVPISARGSLRYIGAGPAHNQPNGCPEGATVGLRAGRPPKVRFPGPQEISGLCGKRGVRCLNQRPQSRKRYGRGGELVCRPGALPRRALP